MKRRTFVGSVLASASLSAAPQAPNVIVFFTDQQRWDSIGAYGNPMGLTPNLDRIASEGVRFENAFTPQPVCAPARSSLQTGKYPTTTGVVRNGMVLKDDETTLPSLFSRRGYETGYIGKWHLSAGPTDAVPLPRRGGYDQFWLASNALEHSSIPYEGKMWDAQNRTVEFRNEYRVDALPTMRSTLFGGSEASPFSSSSPTWNPTFRIPRTHSLRRKDTQTGTGTISIFRPIWRPFRGTGNPNCRNTTASWRVSMSSSAV